MWTCTKCGRVFRRAKQFHSCHKVPLEEHFKNKNEARVLFDSLVKQIDEKIGKNKIISLPCCIHLFGTHDYLAALPKKDGLEIRISLERELDSPRLKISVPLSAKTFKNCLVINSDKDIDSELLAWIKESYYLLSL